MAQEEKDNQTIKLSYEFMKEEAMKSLIKGFQIDEENEELRREKIEQELKERQQHMEESAKKMQLLKEKQEQEQAKMNELMKEELQAAKEKAEREMHAASEAKKKEIMEESKRREDEMKAKMLEEKQQWEKRLADEQDRLQKELEEEKREREHVLRREENAKKARESAKAKLQFDLMDAITPVQQANLFARELGFNTEFAIEITKHHSKGDLVNTVTIVMRDKVQDRTQMWTMDEFRDKFVALQSEYNRSTGQIKRTGSKSAISAFKVSDYSPQVIGHCTVMLSYLFHNIPIKDRVNIISYTGDVQGQVAFRAKLLWASHDHDTRHDARKAETLLDVLDLKHLDIKISLAKCYNLPLSQASQVRCELHLPDFVNSVLLPENYRERQKQRHVWHFYFCLLYLAIGVFWLFCDVWFDSFLIFNGFYIILKFL